MHKLWFAAALLPATTAWAGGLSVNDAGSQSMERGGAWVAKADDPSAMVLNVAGLGKIKKRVEIYLGVDLLTYSESYTKTGDYPSQPDHTPQPTYTGTPYPTVKNRTGPQPLPTLVVVERLPGGFAIAEGVFAPQAYPGRDFACSGSVTCDVTTGGNTPPAPQRYDVIHQTALIALPTLAVAYHHPKFDLGARFSFGFGSLSAETFAWGVKNTEEDPTKDSDFKLSVKDSFIPAFGFGALVRPTDNLEIGASYSSSVKMHGIGTGSAVLGSGLQVVGPDSIEPVPDQFSRCEKGGTATNIKACVDLAIPQWAQLGARWIFKDAWGMERADVELDGKWENWKSASDISVLVDGQDALTGKILYPATIKHGFQDTFSVRLGGAYRMNDLTLRAGAAYDTAAAPTSWTRADMDGKARAQFSVGAAYKFARRVVVDLGFSYIAEPTVTVTNVTLADPTNVGSRVQPDPAQPLASPMQTAYGPFNAGTYTSSYVVGELGITASF